jgi:hypothetical protein
MLAALSFAQHRYMKYQSYYFCAGLMLLDQFHCRCLAVNHGRSAFSSHQQRAMFSDSLIFAVRRRSRSRSHGRLSTKYGKNVLPQRSIYEWIKLF